MSMLNPPPPVGRHLSKKRFIFFSGTCFACVLCNLSSVGSHCRQSRRRTDTSLLLLILMKT